MSFLRSVVKAKVIETKKLEIASDFSKVDQHASVLWRYIVDVFNRKGA